MLKVCVDANAHIENHIENHIGKPLALRCIANKKQTHFIAYFRNTYLLLLFFA